MGSFTEMWMMRTTWLRAESLKTLLKELKRRKYEEKDNFNEPHGH